MKEVTCNRCGTVDDYRTEMKSGQNTAWCNGCGKFIKNIPQENAAFVLPFGKFKGTLMSDMVTQEQISWLNWSLGADFNKNYKEKVNKHLNGLNKDGKSI